MGFVERLFALCDVMCRVSFNLYTCCEYIYNISTANDMRKIAVVYWRFVAKISLKNFLNAVE